VSTNNTAIAALVFLATAFVLVLTAADIGITWDEPTYIVASENYRAWVEELMTNPDYAVSYDGISEYWCFNCESPSFSKLWSGLLWLTTRSLYDDLTAHRIGHILLASLLVALLYLIVAPTYGRTAGLAAAASLLTMPRFFFHSHLAALDVPVTVMTFGATAGF
jgi:hypothetical protein